MIYQIRCNMVPAIADWRFQSYAKFYLSSAARSQPNAYHNWGFSDGWSAGIVITVLSYFCQ
jgi:hypothetical protein